MAGETTIDLVNSSDFDEIMEIWGGLPAYLKNVGIPLSTGAQMLAQGKAMKKGADGVETMLPAEEFVAQPRKRDFVISESLIYL
jgi:hypothetical protein